MTVDVLLPSPTLPPSPSRPSIGGGGDGTTNATTAATANNNKCMEDAVDQLDRMTMTSLTLTTTSSTANTARSPSRPPPHNNPHRMRSRGGSNSNRRNDNVDADFDEFRQTAETHGEGMKANHFEETNHNTNEQETVTTTISVTTTRSSSAGSSASCAERMALSSSNMTTESATSSASPSTAVVTTTDPSKEVEEGYDSSSPPSHTMNNKRFVTPKDFELLKVIGMGAFGKVLQVRNRHTQSIHAMKVISKRLLRRKSGAYIENIMAERAIMAKVGHHPFVVTMQCSFQTREKLFLIMDFLAGGELFLRLGREGIFLEKTAAFYLAEIILALEHLHSLGILHRDLKPENILLGADGHVCLTDFGLAKDFGSGFHTHSHSSSNNNQASTDDKTNNGGGVEGEEQWASTICGTQEYMAPEMIARKGYGRAADYWSLGCIAYEMLSGLPPFDSKQGAKELFRKIMSEKVKMPPGSTAAACKLLKGLLNRDVQKRWGTTKNTMFEVGGVAFLKQAEFFKGIAWDKLEKNEVDPPAVFSVSGEEDYSHFHDEFTTMALPRSVLEMSSDAYRTHRVHSQTFRGFSFIQSDYTTPDRDFAEVQKYWDSLEEDGQSASECASSKFDVEELIGPAATAVAAPVVVSEADSSKKRPPRKRNKKKKGVESASTTPVPSAVTSPMASRATTPTPECGAAVSVGETLEGVQVVSKEAANLSPSFDSQNKPPQCTTPIELPETNRPPRQEGESSCTHNQYKVSPVAATALGAQSPIVKLVPSSTPPPPPAASKPIPKPQNEQWQKTVSKNTSNGNSKQPQSKNAVNSSVTSTHNGNPTKQSRVAGQAQTPVVRAATRWNVVAPVKAPPASTAAATSGRTTNAPSSYRPSAYSHHQLPKPAAPSADWRQHKVAAGAATTTSRTVRHRQQPQGGRDKPQNLPPQQNSHGSSDWRQHTMSPHHSPRDDVRQSPIVNDFPSWPSLEENTSSNDPPLPSPKPPHVSNNVNGNKNLKGAWASRAVKR